jgi:hypothetical protein
MDIEPKGIDELLNGAPDEAPIEDVAPEPVETPEPEQTGPARDEQGRFAPRQTGDEPHVTAEATPANPIPEDQFKGYLTEKRKRQELEEKLATLEQRFQSLQQPKEQPAPPPSIWDDEQGWQQHFGQQVSQFATFNAKLEMSEMLTRKAHDDFDAMKTAFVEMAQQNPALAQQALADPDPWEKAYRIAKNAATMAELGATDIETLRAKIREELLAEQQAQPPAPQVQVPPSLTGERNVGSRTGPAWAGPRSLSELLG